MNRAWLMVVAGVSLLSRVADAAPVVHKTMALYQFVRLDVPVGLGVRLSFPTLRSESGTPERLTAALTNAHLFQLGRPDPARNVLVVTAVKTDGERSRSDLFLSLGRFEVTVELTVVAFPKDPVTDMVFNAPPGAPRPPAVRSCPAGLGDLADYALRSASWTSVWVRERRRTDKGVRLVLQVSRYRAAPPWLTARFRVRAPGVGSLKIESVTLFAMTRLGALIAPLKTGFAARPDGPGAARGVAVARTAPPFPKGLGLQVITDQGEVQARW